MIKSDFGKLNDETKIKKNFNHGYHSIVNLVGYIDNKTFIQTKLADTLTSLKVNALIPNQIIKNTLNYMLKSNGGE